MKTLRVIVFIFFAFLIWNCNSDKKYFYSEDLSISNENGFPKSNKELYFPLDWIKSQYENEKEIFFIDSGYIMRPSELLYAFGEPLLYNFHLNKEIYRLTWIRSFEPDICISLEKQGDTLYLIEKKFKNPFSTKYYRTDTSDIDGYLIPIPSDTTLEVNSKKQIDIEIWNKLENLIEVSQFDTIKPFYTGIPISDGYSWIIEMHKKNKYYMVDRQLGGGIGEIGDYIIEQTRFKEINN